MVTERQSAPYAPPANVLEIIHRYRERNLPEEINAQLIAEIGVPEGNVHRTLSALRFLGLVDDVGTPTAAFASLQIASDSEYQNIFEGLVRTAYSEVFKVVDPGRDSQFILDNHFRRYAPQSQRGRMITLFLMLCREAGIPTIEAPRQRKTKHGVSGGASPRRTSVAPKTQTLLIPSIPSRDVPRPPEDVSSLRREYIAALIARIRQDDPVDPTLLDRIEKLLEQEDKEQRSADVDS